MLIYPGQMDPIAIWAQVYRALLHQDSFTYRRMQTCWYTQGRWTPLLPTNQAQVYRALLHQISPPNWTQVYRALLHQNSITYWQGHMDPPLTNPKVTEPHYTKTVLPIDKGTWTPLIDPKCKYLYHTHNSITYWQMQTYLGQMDPQLIDLKCTEPYYTKQYYPMTRAHRPHPPLLINPKCT